MENTAMNAKLTQRTLTRAALGLCLVAGLASAQNTECSKGCGQSGSKGQELTSGLITHPAPARAPSPLFGVTGRSLVGAPLVTVAQPAQPEARVQSRTVMVQRDDDHEYKVEINNDDVKAWVDGELVPSDRVKVSKKAVRILDEDGETIVEIPRTTQTVTGGDLVIRSLRGQGDSDGPITWQSGGEAGNDGMVFQLAQPDDHPPVMIGITMGPVDEQAAGELDLDADEGITVMSVIEGLPGAEAGLREGDIITAVDGHEGVGQEGLREILNGKEPGDTITLTISRKGKQREIEVELQGYDVSKLGGVSGMEATPFFTPGLGGGDEQRNIQTLIEKLHEQGHGLDENTKREIEEMLRNLQIHQFQGMDAMPRMWFYQGDPAAPSAPRALVNPTSPPDDRLGREHAQRLDRLEQRLDRLESRIDRLIELLENAEHDHE